MRLHVMGKNAIFGGVKLSKKSNLTVVATGLALAALAGCSGRAASSVSTQPTPEPTVQPVPEFCADSAYAYVKSQVDFGPRVPGSEAHRQCADWLASELRRHGADTVAVLTGTVPEVGTISNIFARFNAPATQRILLLAHYDTRPWADEDPDPAKRTTPIDGANDGASGVGVILELARLIGAEKPSVGVDVLLVDAEDSGNEGDEDSWARGTQHFVSTMPYGTTEPLPAAAILLDMVGGRDARFPRELFSHINAPELLDAVWKAARKAGASDRFVNATGGAVNDDHIHLLRAGIPAIDIIECSHPSTGSFNPTWHTTADNLQNIDPATLAAAGSTVTHFIYSTK